MMKTFTNWWICVGHKHNKNSVGLYEVNLHMVRKHGLGNENVRQLKHKENTDQSCTSPEKKTVQLTGFLMSVGEFSFSFKVLPGRSGHHLSTYKL